MTRWGGFGLNWYAHAFANEGFHDAALTTLKISITATIVSTLVATAAALATTRTRRWPGQTAAFIVINLPLMVPEIITAVASLSFFALLASVAHINLGLGNLILVHTVFCIPFAYMPIRARLEDMDLTLEQAAADLYATPWQAFRRVTLPLLMPGISAGRGAGLHRFLRRFHHHPARGRAGPDHAAPLHLGPDAPASDA